MGLTFVVVLFLALVFGVIAAVIGQHKNLNVNHAFLLGALLWPIGVLIVAVRRARPKPVNQFRRATAP